MDTAIKILKNSIYLDELMIPVLEKLEQSGKHDRSLLPDLRTKKERVSSVNKAIEKLTNK